MAESLGRVISGIDNWKIKRMKEERKGKREVESDCKQEKTKQNKTKNRE